MLIDAKDRRYLVTLREGAAFHTHAGIVQHDDLIGASEGSVVRGNTERSFLVLRPTLSDVVLKMPRGAQVIYPKDLGAILLQADIGPGMRVLEAGVGSGALSMTLLRAGRPHHRLRDPRGLRPARRTKNVHDLLGDDVAYDVHIRDVTQGIDERDLDRVLLDMPEPWEVVAHAEAALRPGGILLAYLPTINQTQLLRETLRGSRLRPGGDGRDPAPDLAHRRALGASRTTAWSPTRASSPRRDAWRRRVEGG